MQAEITQKLTPEIVKEYLSTQPEPPPDHYSSADRRKSPRWPLAGSVEFWLPNNNWEEPWIGNCRNLSPGGLGMSCDIFLEVDSIVGIILYLPVGSFHTTATVRYCQKVRDQYMVGLEFLT